jgi:hypothetical protein
MRAWIDNAELIHIVFEPVSSYRTSISEAHLKVEIEQVQPTSN